ncbi:PREDICTED: interferon-like [Calidris pugnax]|uniref:interferon-like n=1 Tax=Calidris pugnax TaxID=198806 RepID=UPI00071CB12F|nr:PREDICTED: interferon-like [Calidris pugnax]XP_014807930.1 PREDICTED: interferon-like [Calidris pugnax]XP_014807932.1 PREDICTED: interferon-like [Calidris pugnax]
MPAPATPHTRLPHAATTLLLLLTALATTLACRHLPLCHTTFPWDSLTILRHMAPTHTCQHHTPLLPFPDTLLHTNQPQQAAAIATHILHNLLAALSSHNGPHHWHHHARQRLLNNLHHRSHQLQQCLTHNATLPQGQAPRNATLTINKYFTRLQRFLHTHNHSACAWDHLRLQARASFQRLHNLTRTICA